MKNFLLHLSLKKVFFIIILFYFSKLYSQSGNCNVNTPYYLVDLSSSIDSVWISPLVVRDGNCCGTTNPDRCVEFYITMNPGTIAIRFSINSGAIPPGSMFYQVNCGPQIPVGDAVCLPPPGPYTLTFCKPGGNENTYKIEAIPAPYTDFFYADVDGYCSIMLNVVGLDPATVQWTDISYGGLYDSYLSCTNCLTPIVNFLPDHPPYVDYEVCGEVLAEECSVSLIFCDTVRVYFYDQLNVSLSEDTTYICEGESNISLIPTVSGGLPPYQFFWYYDGNIVSNDSIFYAFDSGTYILEVRDSTYPACLAIFDTVVVIEKDNPNIYILPSQAGLCLGGYVELNAYGAQTYSWTPPLGLSSTYGDNVIASPDTTTIYNVIGVDEYGCKDTINVLVEIFPLPYVNAGPDQYICDGDSIQLNGSGAWIYEWTPSTNLSNPYISNPIAYPDNTTTYYLIGKSLGSNVIINGDFENGNVDFTTEYNYNIDLIPEGNYYITNNPHNCHPNFARCNDHTPDPANQMMVINGSSNPGTKVWCQNVLVTPNTEYAFSTWLTSVHPLNPAVLQFSINDVLLGSPFVAPDTCNWIQFYETWYSNFNTTAEICIVNQTLILNGNDFAIDDIYFAPLCEGIDSVTVFVNPLPEVEITASSNVICDGQHTQLTASSDIPGTTYQWNNGETTAMIEVSPTTTTTYSVTGTTPEGCTSTAEVTVTVHPLPNITASADPIEICLGESSDLMVSSDIPGTMFSWSNGLGTNSNVTVSPTATTTYSVTGTTPEGCTGTAEVTVTVHPLPNISVSSTPSEICLGESSNLMVSSDIPVTTFSWSNGLGTNSNVTVSPTATTTYSVTGTTPEGCTGTAEVTVTVHTLPNISVSSTPSEICLGESSDLMVSSDIPGTTFNWSNGLGTNSNLTVSPTTTTTYSVTGTTIEGCTGTAEVTVTVHPLPIITVTANPSEICLGESSDLTVSSDIPGTTFSWSNGLGTNPNVTVSPTATTTYSVTGTTPEGCTGTAEVTVTVHPLPNITVTATPTEICLNESSELTVSSDIPGTTFSWSNGLGTNPNVTVSPTATTTYSVTGTSNEGCTGTAEVTVTVHPLPNITASATPTEICLNENSNLMVSSDIPGTTFNWSNGLGTNPNVTVSPAATTTYSVTGTTIEGCTGTTEVTVTVHPLPNITATATPTEICLGESSNLMVSSDIPGTTFNWSNGLGTNSNVTVSPTTTTTYSVTGITPEGCTSTAEITVTVHPLPNITVTATPTEICLNESSELSVSSDIPGTTFSWSNGLGANPNVTVSPTTTTTYSVTGTTIEGCTGTAEVTVTVHPLPIITVTANPSEICLGESSDLTVSSDIPGTTFSWSNGLGTNPNVTVSPTTTTTYSVTGTTPEGCTGTTEVTVTVHPLPNITATATPTEICLGESSNLMVSSDIPGTTFNWSNGLGTNSNLTVSPTTTTTYSVTGTTIEGCTGTAEVTVTVHPLPIITVTANPSEICLGESSDLTVSSDIPGTTFSWSNGLGTNSNVTVSPTATTTYSVTGTTPEGCTGTAEVTVTVHPLPNITATATPTEICLGESSNLMVSSDIPGTTFNWSNGLGTNSNLTVSPTTTATYSVTGTTPEGCTGTAEVTVTVHPLPNITATATPTEICLGESSNLMVSSDIPGTTFNWSNGLGTNSNLTVSPTTTATYSVTGTTPEGCTGTAEVTVTVHPLPNITATATPTEICLGESSNLMVSSDIPGTTFSWSNGLGTNSNVTVSPTATTTYSVTGITPEGCTSTAEITVTVHPLPNITVTATPTEICLNESSELSVSSDIPGTTFNWSNGLGTNPSVTVIPTTTTTYSVTGTTIEGCTGTAEVTVTVHPLPTITASATPTEICLGESSHLMVSSDIPGTTFSWSNGLGTNSNITVSPTATTTYSVTGTTPEGCTGTAEVTVTVHPLPNITATATPTEICLNENSDLMVSSDIPGTTFSWSNDLGTNPNVTVSPTTTTTYSVTGTTPEGCTGTAEVTVTVHPLPTIIASATPSEICLNESLELIVSSDIPGTTFSWSNGLGTNPSVTVSPTTTTTYSVTGTTPEGCTGTAEVTVTVHPLPTIIASATPSEICLNESSELIVSSDIPGTTFSWSNGLGTNPNVTVSPTTTTTYSVTGTTPEGCTGTAEVTVTVHPLPTITVTANPSEICLGESSDLTVSSDIPGTTFSWSNGLGTNPNVTVSPIATTTYSVTGTTPEGCTGTAEVTVTVHPLPNITASATPTEICLNENSNLMVSSDIPGTTFSWSNGLGTNSNVTVSPTTTTTYSVTGTTPEGCTGTAEVTVTVHPLPNITATATPTEICLNENSNLMVSSDIPGTTFNWSNGLGTNSNVTVSPTTTTTYSVTGTTPEGCTGTTEVTVTVHPLPNITVTATPTEICLNESSELSVSSDIPGTTFNWSNGLGTNPSVTVIPTTTTTYSVTGTTIEGCTGTAEVTVTVHPLPTIIASATPSEICLNESSELTVSSDIPGTTFSWSNGLGTNPNVTVSPTATTTYSVTGTTPEGCTGTAEVTVTVHPLPTITASATPTEICHGESSDLMVSSDIPGTTFSWSNGLGTNPNVTVSPIATTTYSVTGTTLEGCTGTAEVIVTVHPLPTIIASATPTEICLGESSHLMVSSDIPGTTFSWSNGLGTNSNITVSPTATTTYSVTGTTPEGCTGTTEVTVTVHPLPNITVTATPTEICLNESSELSVSSDIPGTTFNWSNGLGTNPSVTVIPTTTTTYSVTGTTIEGCTGTAEVTVTVHPLPTITASATPTEICLGESSDLMVSSDIPGTTFSWSNGLGTNSNITVSPTATTTYSVTGTTPEGCTGTAEVTVTVHPLPNITASATPTEICLNENSNLMVSSDIPGTTFSWSNDLGTNPNVTVSPIATTTYSVTGTSNEGCTGTAEVTVTVHPLPELTATANPTEICHGESSDLMVSSDIPGTTFNWSNGLGTNPSVTVSPTATTTYSVTGTTQDGCTGTASVTVTVHPLPTIIDSATPSEICLNESSELIVSSDIPGTTFSWSNGLGTNPSVTVSPTATTTYSVTGTTPEGCTGIAEVTVTVHPLPNITASATPTDICLGESSDLMVSSDIPGTTFNWSNGLGTNPNVTVSPAATTTYSVTGTTIEGCTGTAEVTVTVNPLPELTATANPSEICLGESSDLMVSSDIPGTTFNWSNGLGTNPNVTVSPTTTTTYSVTGTTPEGCTGTAEVTVTVHPLPTIIASATPSEICLNESSELIVSSDIPGTTFSWSNGLGTNPNVTVSPTATTTYSVTGTTPEGCTGTAEVTVTVHPLPNITASATPTEICLGESSDLMVSSDIPGTTFSWSNGLGTNPSVTVSPIATTTYSVTGTTPEGCTGTAEVTVTVHPLPNITASATPTDICHGESSDLMVSSDIPGTTFNWSNGLGTNPSVTVSPTATTTYSVTGTTPEGCTGTAEVTVTVHPLPTITVTANPTEICLNESSDLIVSSDIPGTTFSWSNGLGTNPSVTVSPTATTTYSVTGTTLEGCTGTASVTVTVHPLPTITASATPTEICHGESSDLMVSSDIPGTTFNWSNGLGTNPNVTVSPIATTTYSVTGTTLEGCTGTAEVIVTVHPLPTITVTANPTEICLNESSDLMVSSDIPGTTFSWSNGLGTNPSVTVSPTTTTTYSVTGTTPEGCTGTAEVTVTVHPLPTIIASATPSEICLNESSELIVSSDIPGTTFSWSNGLGTNPNVTVSPTATTTYSVTGTTPEGCTGTAEVTVTVHPLPTITVTANPTEICLNESSELSVSSDIPGTTFNWSNGLGTNPSVTVIPTTTTTYSVTGTTIEGCTGTAEVTVTVHPLPTITASATPTEICLGESSHLMVSSDIPGTTFSWSNGLGTNSNITVSPTATTTYSVTGTTPEGCTGTAEVTVTVHPLPNITATATPTEICLNENSDLMVSSDIPGTTFSWSNDLGTNPNVTVSPTTTTTYSVTGTTPEGCTGTAEVTVTVHPLPNITVTATPTEICLNESSELTVSSDIPGTTFSWSNGLGTNSNVTVSPTATTTYSVTGITPEGCTSTAEITVTVHPLPNITASATPTEICLNENSNLMVSSDIPGTTFSWSNGLGTNPSVTVIPTTTTTYSVTGTTIEGCTGTAEVTVTVHPLPTITASATPTEICLGENSELTVSSDVPGTTFSWSNDLGTNPNVTVSPTTTTTYSVTGTTPEGCTGTAEVTVTVHPLPNITVTATPTEICLNESSELTVSSDIPGTTFSWSNGLGTNPNVTVSPTATTTYSVTGTTPEGCTGTAEVTVTVHPLPNITASATPTEICLNENSNLMVSSDIPGTTFSWSNGLGTNPSVTVIPTTTTTYSVTGTTIEGCTGTAEVTVTVHPLPIITVTANPSEICLGESSDLTVSSDIPGTTFSWSNGLGTNPNVTVSPTATTTYSVTGTTPEGCTGTAEVTVTVHPLPNITASATPTEICLNENSNLMVSSDIPGTTFSWSNGLGTNSNVTVSPTTTTTYSVTGTTPEGCTGTAEVTVTVHPLPNITATATPTEICLGESSNLMVSSDIPGTTFSWSNGLGTNPSVTVSPIATTTYSVTGTTPEGCTGTAEVTVTVHPLPNITASATPTDICHGESSDLMVSSDIPGTTFNWSNGLGTNPSVTVSPTATTTYSVTGTTVEGCTGTATVTVTVHPLPTINFSVNPAHCGQSDGSISLNINGAVPPYTYNWSNGYTDANLNNILAGNYIVTVTDAIGCTSSATIYVEDLTGPTANFTFKPQMTTIENPLIYFQNYSTGATSYYWTFGDDNSSEEFAPNHIYVEPGSYHVVLYAIDDYNCIDTVGAQIIIKDISTFYIPNAIMPHSGNINSIFNVFGVNIDPDNFEMRIFNRWGNQIFYTTNPNIGWDGTYNGEYVQEGSYSYIFNFITETDGIKHTVIGKVLVLY